MILESARKAFAVLTKPKFRYVLLKSIGLTILLFIGVWFAAESLFATFLLPSLAGWPWIATIFIWLLGAGVFVGAGFMLAPVSAIFAGLFLDDVAEFIEEESYPQDGIGQPVPIGHALWLAVRFLGLVIVANLLALISVPLLGIGFGIFFLVNGYLLGREYFTFAAMRFRSESDVKEMHKKNSTYVLLGGLIIAGFMAIPILNLATPVFAAALMVHLHKALTKRYPDNSVPNYD